MQRVLVAERATLLGQMWEVLFAPFGIVIVATYVHRWPLAFIAIVCTILYLSGADMGSPNIDRETLMVWGGIVVFLWFVAALLTVRDHFIYGGWTFAKQDAEKTPLSFVQALLDSKLAEAYSLCTIQYQLTCKFNQFEAAANIVIDRLGPCRLIMVIDEPGRFRLPIMAGAVPLLNVMTQDDPGLVALVFFTEARDGVDPKRVPAVRMRLKSEDGYRVDAFNFVQASLNQPCPGGRA